MRNEKEERGVKNLSNSFFNRSSAILVILLLSMPASVLATKVVDKFGNTTFYGVFVGENAGDTAQLNQITDDLKQWPGWAANNIKVLEGGKPTKDATRAKIKAAIDAYKANAKSGDEFIFWYFGHGSAGALGGGPNGKVDTPWSSDDIRKTDKSTGKEHISPDKDGVFESGPPLQGSDDIDLGRVDGNVDQGEEEGGKPDIDDEPKKGDRVQIGTDENGEPLYRVLETDDRYDETISVDQDTDAKGLTSDRITDDELTDMLSGFKFCVTIVIVLDSCFASKFTDGAHDLQTIKQKFNDNGVIRDWNACSIAFEGPDGFSTADTWLTTKINLFGGLKNDGGTTKADKEGNNNGITTLKELHDLFKTGTYGQWWIEFDNDGDTNIDEDGDEHLENSEGTDHLVYHDDFDDDGDGFINEDPKPICYVYLHYFYTSTGTTFGGVVVSVDKLGLLAPHIGLASAMIIVTIVTAFCIKRAKLRKDK